MLSLDCQLSLENSKRTWDPSEEGIKKYGSIKSYLLFLWKPSFCTQMYMKEKASLTTLIWKHVLIFLKRECNPKSQAYHLPKQKPQNYQVGYHGLPETTNQRWLMELKNLIADTNHDHRTRPPKRTKEKTTTLLSYTNLKRLSKYINIRLKSYAHKPNSTFPEHNKGHCYNTFL